MTYKKHEDTLNLTEETLLVETAKVRFRGPGKTIKMIVLQPRNPTFLSYCNSAAVSPAPIRCITS